MIPETLKDVEREKETSMCVADATRFTREHRTKMLEALQAAESVAVFLVTEAEGRLRSASDPLEHAWYVLWCMADRTAKNLLDLREELVAVLREEP